MNERNYKTNLVTKLAFLTGVRSTVLEKEDGLFEKEALEILAKNDVDTTLQIAYLNQMILDNIESLRTIFPPWVEWSYLRELFMMPNCHAGVNGSNLTTKDKRYEIKNQIHAYRKYFFDYDRFFPYNVYINWPISAMPMVPNNMFQSDYKFFNLLYNAHNEVFHAGEYLIDANNKVKDTIYDFLDQAEKATLMVDCENVDPYHFLAVIRNLDKERLKKITKIILFDDINTTNAWDLLPSVLEIPTEHKEVSRVLNKKSLVDQDMMARAYTEFYVKNTDSIILASSDSDFWALINNLREAKFYVLNEEKKTSQNVLSLLNLHNIPHCFIEEFATDKVQDFKLKVVMLNLQKRIDDFNNKGVWSFSLDPLTLVNILFEEAKISESPLQLEKEKEDFFRNFLRKGFCISIEKKGEEKVFKLTLNKP